MQLNKQEINIYRMQLEYSQEQLLEIEEDFLI
jgi:hypothetical protein